MAATYKLLMRIQIYFLVVGRLLGRMIYIFQIYASLFFVSKRSFFFRNKPSLTLVKTSKDGEKYCNLANLKTNFTKFGLYNIFRHYVKKIREITETKN